MTTLIFAAVAVIVVWKLWSVLGSRTGTERPPSNPFAKAPPKAGMATDAAAMGSNVIRLPGAAPAPVAQPGQTAEERWKGFAQQGSPVWAGLDAIAAADPSFAVQPFVKGAKIAYETVVAAFAAGDRKELRALVAKDVFDGFNAAIAERESRGEKSETTFVSIDDAVIEEAQVRGGQAQITLRFAVKLIHATRAKDGSVVEGSPEKVNDLADVWTFVRPVSSRDPNWQVSATEAAS